MIPMTITAVMAEPIAHYRGDGLHLDGPLQWAAYIHHRRQHGEPNTPPDEAPDFDMPVQRWTCPPPPGTDPRVCDDDGRLWGWCCSAAAFLDERATLDYVRKKPALDEMMRWSKTASFNYGIGPSKAKNVPVPLVMCRAVQWHAVGIPDGVRPLLDELTHIGRLVGHGYGRVLEWEIDSSDDPDAWMRRILPATYPGVSGHVTRKGVRPPYWHRSRSVHAVIPC